MQEIQTSAIVADFMARLKDSTASGLLLDYDGTLAPFQTDRFRAYPYPGIIPILQRILRHGKSRVVIVTGRPVEEVRALLHPLENLEIWGAHGLEHLLRDGTYRQAAIDPENVKTLIQAEEWLKAVGMVSMAEIKPGGIALHWRGLHEEEVTRIGKQVKEGWSPLADGSEFKLLEFDGGLELRVLRPNKGDAVTSILQSLDADAPVAFLGDDLTDEDAFEVMGDRGLPILVRSEYRATRAKAWLRPPHQLTGFLEQWLRAISA